MNFKNVLYKRKRNKIVKEVMKELKLTIYDMKLFVPFDEVKEPMEKAIMKQLKNQSRMKNYDNNT